MSSPNKFFKVSLSFVFLILFSVFSLACVDSDGMDFSNRGYIVDNGQTYYDYCESPQTLIEYTCSFEKVHAEKALDMLVCRDGAFYKKSDYGFGSWIASFFQWVGRGIMVFFFGNNSGVGSAFEQGGLFGAVGAGIGTLATNSLIGLGVGVGTPLYNFFASSGFKQIVGLIVGAVVIFFAIKFLRPLIKMIPVVGRFFP